MLASWARNYDGLLERYMAPDFIWEQPPLPTTKSIDEALALLRNLGDAIGFATVDIDVRSLVAEGNMVMAERMDHIRRGDGSLIASVAVTGVIEFNDEGKIIAWREYFDPTELMKLMPS